MMPHHPPVRPLNDRRAAWTTERRRKWGRKKQVGLEELPAGIALTSAESSAFARTASGRLGLACCAIEMMAAGTPPDSHGALGSSSAAPPLRHSDMMIVSGRVRLLHKMALIIRHASTPMPEPASFPCLRVLRRRHQLRRRPGLHFTSSSSTSTWRPAAPPPEALSTWSSGPRAARQGNPAAIACKAEQAALEATPTHSDEALLA